jgi:hypothetical protein
MAFTKSHYEEVAGIIRAQRARVDSEYGPALRMGLAPAIACGALGAIDGIQGGLRRMFASQNPKFDAARFDKACEPRGEK